LRFDGLLLDLDDRTMSVHDQLLDTPAKEFDLLAFLAARPGQVFTRVELLHQVWKSKPEWQNVSTVTEHIHRLRSKIETDPNKPRFLRTVRGFGYSFQAAGPLTPVPDVTDARWGTWMHVDYRFVAADEGMVALLAARTPADLIGHEVSEFVSPASQPVLRARRGMRAAGLVPGPQVITLRAVDGTERLTLVSTDSGEFDGGPAVVGITREIFDAPQLMR
jgi:hypothetical protein